MNKKEMFQKWEKEILFPILQETVFIMQKEVQQKSPLLNIRVRWDKFQKITYLAFKHCA